mgnify:CR=1 FL=1
MCLLKVYLDEGEAGRKLITRDVSLVAKEGGKVRVRDIGFNEVTLEGVDVVLVDALNSILILKKV